MYWRNWQKFWVCLFPYVIYRTAHLELTSSLTVSSFLLLLRGFVARCGRPKIIYSDNWWNFIRTENAFSKLEWKEVKEYCAVARMEWSVSQPTAAWWCGFRESLIGIFKKLISKVLGRASLDYEELNTIICICEAVINNLRPIIRQVTRNIIISFNTSHRIDKRKFRIWTTRCAALIRNFCIVEWLINKNYEICDFVFKTNILDC